MPFAHAHAFQKSPCHFILLVEGHAWWLCELVLLKKWWTARKSAYSVTWLSPRLKGWRHERLSLCERRILLKILHLLTRVSYVKRCKLSTTFFVHGGKHARTYIVVLQRCCALILELDICKLQHFAHRSSGVHMFSSRAAEVSLKSLFSFLSFLHIVYCLLQHSHAHCGTNAAVPYSMPCLVTFS